ncbi:MAG: hypothetical protein PGN09_08460 [Sphingomonas fennica]
MTQEIVPFDAVPPALRRAERLPERVLYVARAGFGALPSGIGMILLVATPQLLSFGFILWAIWWPYPRTPFSLMLAYGCTAAMAGLVLLVGWALARKFSGFVGAVLRAPFTRITVTDRRVLWTLPWASEPLMEIARHRILGGMLGPVDRRGRGSAAMVLVEGDPSADVDGNIHFDGLPHAARFVAALA